MPSTSETQRRLFGAALNCKRGGSCVSPKIAALADRLDEDKLREFARKPLDKPKKKREVVLIKVRRRSDSSDEPPTHCPYCGSKLNLGATYCDSCERALPSRNLRRLHKASAGDCPWCGTKKVRDRITGHLGTSTVDRCPKCNPMSELIHKPSGKQVAAGDRFSMERRHDTMLASHGEYEVRPLPVRKPFREYKPR